MADDPVPLTNPFSSASPYAKPVSISPQSGERGLKTVSTLFIVFGIVGLLTLPGILIGAALQIFMPQFDQFGAGFADSQTSQAYSTSDAQANSTSELDPQSPEPENEDRDGAISDTEQPTVIDPPPQPENAVKQLEKQMEEFQKFNLFGFFLGLVNVLLSGLLVWAGIGLSQKKLSAAKIGVWVCSLCCLFEVVRLLFGAWINFRMIRAFMTMATAAEEAGVPLGMIMTVSIAVGFLFTLLYAIGKIVMYVLCSRHLMKPHVQALLVS